MFILDIPRRAPTESRYISLPFYHRTHLSLAETRKLHVCLLPSQAIPAIVTPNIPVPELVASPFEFERWGRLWRITAALRERAGLVHDAMSVLGSQGVRLLAAESTTSHEEGLHLIEMFVDVPGTNQIQHLEWSLLAALIDDFSFGMDSLPRLRIRRVQALAKAKALFEELTTSNGVPGTRTVPFRPVHEVADVDAFAKDGHAAQGVHVRNELRLRVPGSIRDILRACVTEVLPGHERPIWGYQLRMSDTKNRLLRVLFFKNSEPVIHARIEHNAETGAAAQVTSSLRDAGFNILSQFFAPAANNRARLEVVLRLVDGSATNTPAIKQRLQATLTNLAGDLQIDIGYPRGYSKSWEAISLPRKPNKKHAIPPSGNGTPPQNLFARLEARRGELVQQIQGGHLEGDDIHRWGLINSLKAKHDVLAGGQAPGTLFISCHYVGSHLQLAKAVGEQLGFKVLTGENLVAEKEMRSGLVKRIGFCSHYLGVWSATGAKRIDDQFWPSPWLLWEAGVAEARGLVMRFLIADAISDDAWRKLFPGQQHLRYSETNFESQLRTVIEVLGRLPTQQRSSLLSSGLSEPEI